MRKNPAKQIDKLIEQTYYKVANGVQINIMDINKVFTAGRKAIQEGRDLESAILEVVAAIRKN